MDYHSENLLSFIMVYLFILLICLLYCRMTRESGTVPSQPHVMIQVECAQFCPGAGHTLLASLDISLPSSLQPCHFSTLEVAWGRRQLGDHIVRTASVNPSMTLWH